MDLLTKQMLITLCPHICICKSRLLLKTPHCLLCSTILQQIAQFQVFSDVRIFSICSLSSLLYSLSSPTRGRKGYQVLCSHKKAVPVCSSSSEGVRPWDPGSGLPECLHPPLSALTPAFPVSATGVSAWRSGRHRMAWWSDSSSPGFRYQCHHLLAVILGRPVTFCVLQFLHQ